MLTTRETATLLLVGAVALVLLFAPKIRRKLAPSIKQLLRAGTHTKLLTAYLIVMIVSATSTAVAGWLGLWNWTMAKEATLLTATVVFPMTFRSFTFKSGGELSKILTRETVGLAALLAFYLDSKPLPLIGEIIFQIAATLFLLLRAVAAIRTEYLPVRRLCDATLDLLGAFIITWTTIAMVTSPPVWSEFFRSLLFSFWLPLSLLPFFYVFGFYATADSVLARFRALRRPLTPRVVLAFMIGTRMRLSLLARFNGKYNNVAEAAGFRDALHRMSGFRKDLKRRDSDELKRLEALEHNRGVPGVDEHGCHKDRREFYITKKRLDWIWSCQNGQFERQGNRYWGHLTDLIVDAERHGLPLDHGFKVEIGQQGQVWRSWRRTPSGAVLGTGGAKHRSQYYYQGDEPPKAWPGSSPEWINAATETWPPDWDRDDGTRL